METTFSSSTATAASKGKCMLHSIHLLHYSYIPITDAHENKKKEHVLSLSILYFFIPHPSLIVSYKLSAGALYMFISWTTPTISIGWCLRYRLRAIQWRHGMDTWESVQQLGGDYITPAIYNRKLFLWLFTIYFHNNRIFFFSHNNLNIVITTK